MQFVTIFCFQDQIVETVAVTAELEVIYKRLEKDNPNTYAWRYFASENGIFRIFPGIKLIKNYNAAKTRW